MVMLPRRSRETFHARDNFAYFNNKVFEQLCAVNENDARDTATNFIEFAVRSKQLFETPVSDLLIRGVELLGGRESSDVDVWR